MAVSQTVSASQSEATTNPLSSIEDCTSFLQSLPQGAKAMKYAAQQAQQAVQSQASI